MSCETKLEILIWILSWILGQYTGKRIYRYLKKKKALKKKQ